MIMNFEEENKRLVEYLVKSRAIKSKRVKNAFLRTPRHLFVPERYETNAYLDMPLPSLKGQTISQPTIVAVMIEGLELKKGQKVLEVGAGTGWNACLIARCVFPGKVIAIDIEEEIVEFAKNNINRLGVKNIEIIYGDGSIGYEKEAPYDRCIVTAACPKIPQPLIDQLKPDGKLIAPVGDVWSQRLILYEKRNNKIKDLGGCVFVKLKGKYGFD
ncbi:MAG: protein-L-isoaspartate(D-aspartate) O-methyltransferase [Candidatus Aenigmatarchaeota archaeon]